MKPATHVCSSEQLRGRLHTHGEKPNLHTWNETSWNCNCAPDALSRLSPPTPDWLAWCNNCVTVGVELTRLPWQRAGLRWDGCVCLRACVCVCTLFEVAGLFSSFDQGNVCSGGKPGEQTGLQRDQRSVQRSHVRTHTYTDTSWEEEEEVSFVNKIRNTQTAPLLKIFPADSCDGIREVAVTSGWLSFPVLSLSFTPSWLKFFKKHAQKKWSRAQSVHVCFCHPCRASINQYRGEARWVL